MLMPPQNVTSINCASAVAIYAAAADTPAAVTPAACASDSAADETKDNEALPADMAAALPGPAVRTTVSKQDRFIGAGDLIEMVERLPRELSNEIYKHAGILTQYMHRQFGETVSPVLASTLWAECLYLDDLHFVGHLPAIQLTWELVFVRSEAMLQRLAETEGLGVSIDGSLTGLDFFADIRNVGDRWFGVLQMAARHSSKVQTRLFAFAEAHYRLSPHLYSRRAVFLIVAAATGRIADVQRVLPDMNSLVAIEHAIDIASEHGHIDIVDLLRSGLQTTHHVSIASAATNNHLTIVQCLCRNFPNAFASTPVDELVKLHHNKTLIWLLTNTDLINSAELCADIQFQCVLAQNGEMLEFAIEHNIGDPLDLAVLFDRFPDQVHRELLEWIQDKVVRGSDAAPFAWPRCLLRIATQRQDSMLIAWLNKNIRCWHQDE